MGQNRDAEQIASIESFIDQGRIEEVLGVIKSGKEATVYLCVAGALARGTAGEQLLGTLIAAKVYRSRDVRSFRDDAVYRHGRTTGSNRADRGLRLKTRTGQELRFAEWVSAEYETLRLLHRAGADVPEAIGHGGQTVLMEYIADGDEPAAPLIHAGLSHSDVRRVLDRLLRNIELMLANDRVHGDLSPYNVLYRSDGRLTIIDFPQAVDARVNANALELLGRDIDRVCAWAARSGVECDAAGVTRRLWGRFLRAEL